MIFAANRFVSIPLPWKMVMSFGISILAIVLMILKPTRARICVMIAMILSSVGDAFLGGLIKNVPNSLVIGSLMFILAHIVYSIGYIIQTKKRGKYFNTAFFIGLAVMIISALHLVLINFTYVAKENWDLIWLLLILVYIAMIGFHACSTLSYAQNQKNTFRKFILPLAIFLFYLTDFWIFEQILGIDPAGTAEQFIWIFYPIAQLLIVLFAAPLPKKKSK